MKITAIKPYPIWVGHRNQLIVKIETDEGVYGWGESGLSGREKAVVGALEHYARIPRRQATRSRIGALVAGAAIAASTLRAAACCCAAQSALDIRAARHQGQGAGRAGVRAARRRKHRDVIPTFASTGSIADDGNETLASARNLIERGWSTIRFFPAALGQCATAFSSRARVSARRAKFLIRAREGLGEDVVLGIDYHHRLSVAETASFCQKMPSGTLDFLEEPIRDETPEASESLRTLTDVPFAIGEEFSSKWQFLPYIERGIHQYQPARPLQCRRLHRGDEGRRLVEAHYVDLMPHNPLGPICTAATIHFSAAVANFFALEVRANATDLYAGTPTADLFPTMPTPGWRGVQGSRWPRPRHRAQ